MKLQRKSQSMSEFVIRGAVCDKNYFRIFSELTNSNKEKLVKHLIIFNLQVLKPLISFISS